MYHEGKINRKAENQTCLFYGVQCCQRKLDLDSAFGGNSEILQAAILRVRLPLDRDRVSQTFLFASRLFVKPAPHGFGVLNAQDSLENASADGGEPLVSLGSPCPKSPGAQTS